MQVTVPATSMAQARRVGRQMADAAAADPGSCRVLRSWIPSRRPSTSFGRWTCANCSKTTLFTTPLIAEAQDLYNQLCQLEKAIDA